MDNFSEQMTVFCHRKPRLGASVLRTEKFVNAVFENKKKLDLLVESIKRFETEAVYCQHV